MATVLVGVGATGGAPLAGGSAAVEPCDRDGVQTTQAVSFVAGVGYAVTSVRVDGIDRRCAGRHVSVALSDRRGAVLAVGGPATVGGDGGSVTLLVPGAAVSAISRVDALVG